MLFCQKCKRRFNLTSARRICPHCSSKMIVDESELQSFSKENETLPKVDEVSRTEPVSSFSEQIANIGELEEKSIKPKNESVNFESKKDDKNQSNPEVGIVFTSSIIKDSFSSFYSKPAVEKTKALDDDKTSLSKQESNEDVKIESKTITNEYNKKISEEVNINKSESSNQQIKTNAYNENQSYKQENKQYNSNDFNRTRELNVRTTEKVRVNNYRFNGKIFKEGQEDEALFFLYNTNQFNQVFESITSKEFKSSFLSIVKAYYQHDLSKIQEFNSFINQRKENYSKELLFHFIFMYLLNILIINSRGHAKYTFNTKVDCINLLSNGGESSTYLLNNYYDVISYFLELNNKNLSRHIFDETKKILSITQKRKEFTISLLGSEEQFIDTLLSTENIEEKCGCIKEVFRYEDFVSKSDVEQEVLEFLKIDSSLINQYLYNVKFYCSRRIELNFFNKYFLTNKEKDFFDFFARAKKANDNYELENFARTIIYFIKKDVFNKTNFEMFNYFKVNNKTIKDLSNESYENFIKEVTSSRVEKYVYFDNKYMLALDMVININSMDNNRAVLKTTNFVDSHLNDLLKNYGVMTTKEELKKEIMKMKGI